MLLTDKYKEESVTEKQSRPFYLNTLLRGVTSLEKRFSHFAMELESDVPDLLESNFMSNSYTW